MKTLSTSNLEVESLSPEERDYAYNGLDCLITHECFNVLSSEIPLATFPYNMSRAMQGPAFTLTNRGIKIDLSERDNSLRLLMSLRDRCEHILFRLTTEGLGLEPIFDKKNNKTWGINPRSPAQLQRLFYSILKCEPVKIYDRQTKEHRVTTNREALEKLESQPRATIFTKIISAIRDQDKKIQVLKTGIEKGRMHCSYHVVGTLTGRWSSSESVFGSGTNLQNITDEMRKIFIPDDGLKLCSLDLSQAESFLVAYLSLPYGNAYYEACHSGDVHTRVAQLVWPENFAGRNTPPREIAESPFYRHFSYRDMSKRGGHANNYLVTPSTLATNIKIPISLATSFQNRYFKGFPEIPKWQNSVRIKLATTRMITTAFGRRCHFPGRPYDSDTIKSAIAYEPQSTIGDALNLGFYNVWRKYDKIWSPTNPIEILLQVHDSIIFQYNPKDESWIVPLIQKELQIPITINGKTLLIGVDAAVGWNWAKRTETKNPQTGEITITNPYGLVKYKDGDPRSPPPKKTIEEMLNGAAK